MTISARACQAASEYLGALGHDFVPEVVREFHRLVLAMVDDPRDRSADVFALIENHDVTQEHRTGEAVGAELQRQLGLDQPEDGAPPGAPDGIGDPTPG
jgi:hypothetical protein